MRPTFVSVSTVVAVLCFAAPLATEAQIGKVARVGFLYFGSRETGVAPGRYAAFLEGLRELGYVEGKTVIVEARFAESRAERIPDLVADLMRPEGGGDRRGGYGLIPSGALDGAPAITVKRLLSDDLRRLKQGKIDIDDLRGELDDGIALDDEDSE